MRAGPLPRRDLPVSSARPLEPRASLWMRALPLFGVALALRLACVVALDAPSAARGASAWSWGAEQACMAHSLWRGDGFGDPWGHATGTSAWLTPVYPGLLAAAMALGGGIGAAAAWLVLGLQCALDACTALVIARLGRHLGLPRSGWLGAWLWALYPLALWHAAQTIWDTTICAFAGALFFERFAALAFRREARGAALAGLFYGTWLLVNPAPEALAPVLLLAVFVGARPLGGLRASGHTALFAGAALCVCLPWMLRNQRALGTLQLRPNYGVELMIGNHARASGHPEPFKYHPSHVEAELAEYRRLGEVAYSERCFARARAWLEAEPLAFLALTAVRFELFWLGRPPPLDPRRSGDLAAAGDPKSWLKWLAFAAAALAGWLGLARADLGRRARWLAAAVLLAYGVPYYLSHVSERYRFPIDPLLALGAGALVARERRDALGAPSLAQEALP